MAKPKANSRRKSVLEEQTRRPREVVVRFSLPDPPKSDPTDAKATGETAKKGDTTERPPLTFRF